MVIYSNIQCIKQKGQIVGYYGRRNFSEITPEIKKLDKICENNSRIDPKLYSKYKVFRGLEI